MGYHDDTRVSEAKALPMTEVIDRLGVAGLRKNAWELSGPCPICGASGHNPKSGRVDRFNINLRTNQWLCRKCGEGGGDQISLVRFVEQCSFPEALTFLCGQPPEGETEEQRQARARKAAAARQRVEAEARAQAQRDARFRQRAVEEAKRLWSAARDGNLGVVPTYLKARGIDKSALPVIPDSLRFVVDLPYLQRIDGGYTEIHRGPAMIAKIVNRHGEVAAVHRTWIDPNPPHGKAKIVHNGEVMVSKKVLGSKQGGGIPLHTPPDAEILVMGEGIETTLTAMVAAPFENAAYWAGVDLGNMSGRMQRIRGTRYSGIPDMADTDAFVPPAWVKRLVFIMDGDSDPAMTRAKLECGLRRAMSVRTHLQGQIVHAGQGVDLNDVLVGAT